MKDSNFGMVKISENEQVLQLQDSINQAIQQSQEIEFVVSAMDVETASHFTKNLSKIEKTAEVLRKAEVDPLNEKVKETNSFFKKILLPVQNEVTRLKGLLLDFDKKQKETARLKAEAERKAAEEKAIQEAIEKEDRLKKEADEKKGWLDRQKASAERAMTNGSTRDELLSKIKDLITKGDILYQLTETEINYILGEVKEIKIEAPKVEVAIIPETVIENKKLSSANSSGVGTRKVAKWEITDEKLIPDEYWILDEVKINTIRKAAGVSCETSSIPGIRFYTEETLSIR